jgi:hypothetical protein
MGTGIPTRGVSKPSLESPFPREFEAQADPYSAPVIAPVIGNRFVATVAIAVSGLQHVVFREPVIQSRGKAEVP